MQNLTAFPSFQGSLLRTGTTGWINHSSCRCKIDFNQNDAMLSIELRLFQIIGDQTWYFIDITFSMCLFVRSK